MFVSHFQSKIQEANQLKMQGNQSFKIQKYEEAKLPYQKALELVQPFLFHGATDLQKNKAFQLRANLFFNIGLCSFNSRYWRDAQQKFTEALGVNPNYMKAYCKRALARYELGSIQQAVKDITKALDLDPEHQNREVQAAFDKIMQKYQQSKQAQQPNPPNPSVKQQVKEVIQSKSEPKSNYFLWKLLGVTSLIGLGVYLANKNSTK